MNEMTPYDLRRVTLDVARARVLLTLKRYEEAADLLDDAAECLPDKYWPRDSELLPEEAK